MANTTGLAADYWDFYGVEAPTFNGTIMIADDATGKNARSLESLNMTANVDTNGKAHLPEQRRTSPGRRLPNGSRTGQPPLGHTHRQDRRSSEKERQSELMIKVN